MRIDEFITKLRKDHNIIVGVNGSELKIQAQQKDLTHEIIAELKEKKAEIIAFFNSANSKEVFQSIAKVSKKDHYKLSSAQKRQYFLYELDSSSTAYNMPQVVTLEGEIDRDRINTAFNRLLERHEVLRTYFEIVDKEPIQKIQEQVQLKIEDIKAGAEEAGAAIKRFIRPFDLSKAPLIRVGLIEIDARTHILMVDVHHIITDGVSQEILLKDFLALYNNEALPELQVQYKDYAEWQQSPAHTKENDKQKAYWLKMFDELPAKLELPTDFARPAVRKFSGSALQFELTKEETRKLQAIADQQGATMFMAMLSIYNIFIKKISNQDDVIIGTPTAGRQHVETQHMIGMFLNNVTLRNQPKDDLPFSQFLADVKEKTLDGFDNQGYQFEELINDLKIERDSSRNPLFDVRFVFQNYEKSEFTIPGLTIKPYGMEREVSQFDITLYVEAGEQIKFSFNYSTELFKKETIERFISYFKAIVQAVISNNNVKIADIDILSEEERNMILKSFNSTAAEVSEDRSIIDIFNEQVAARENEVAAAFNNKTLTYGELDLRSNQLAHELISKNKAEVVGMYMEPSLEMVIGIWGILKSGAAFLPLDPKQRSVRQENILKESGCQVLLAQQKNINDLAFEGVKLAVDAESELVNASAVNLSRADKLAYVIYTSGSTGQPKGVKIKNSNVVNYSEWLKKFLQLTALDKSLLTSSFAFDLGYTSIFPVLLSGGELHLISSDVYQSPDDLLNYIGDNEITYLKVTPSLFSTFAMASGFKNNSLSSVRYIVMGGEQIRIEPIELTHKVYPKIQFVNHYGPTETTIGAVAVKIEDIAVFRKRPVIGKPISNTQLFILDKNEGLLPVGVAGELCIAGQGVGNGYLNMPELSAEKFVTTTPYAPVLYKTGDLARWLPDGKVEFLGRIDNQVKIRGYRVELGEIESQLSAHKEVKDAVVIALENEAGEKYLVAYYVADTALDATMLKSYLTDLLPDYMVPAQYIQIEAIPLTPNGKLDKKELPRPEFKTEGEGVKPSTDTELQLLDIWAELLKKDKESIGANDDFFDMGGNSIVAIRLNYNIQQKFSVQLHMRQVFENPTIQKLAAVIESSQTKTTEEIVKIGERDEYIASSAQQRLYYEHQLDAQGLNYNISNVYRLVGNADFDKMEKAFQALTDRHESLRTGFHLNTDGEVVQTIQDKVHFELGRLHSESYSSLKDAVDEFVRPFDLSKPGLMRGGIFQHEQLGNFLFLDMHHIICDGISKNILMNDFRQLYKGEQLPALDMRYIDYAAWQRNPKSSVAKQKDFWMKKLSGELTGIQLPRLQEKEAVTDNLAADQGMKFDGELFDRIKNYTSASNVSDFMFLLSIYYVLLSKISGNTDLIIGTDVAGRTHPNLDNVVGTFVNFLPLRVRIGEEQTYTEFLEEVKECVLEAFENQDFQYDQMVSSLKEQGNSDGNIFDVHFALANYLDHGMQLDDLKFELVQLKWAETSQFEFKIHAVDERDRFLVYFVYNKTLYDDETMALLMKYYKNILLNVLADSTVKISDLEMENVVDMMPSDSK